MKKFLLLLSTAALLLGAAAAPARDAMTVQSAYLGDGWFRYTVHTTYDPYFLYLDTTWFALGDATGLERGLNPPHWTNSPLGPGLLWIFAGNGVGHQVLPYDASFLVHSDRTTFKRGPLGATILMSLSTAGGHGYPVLSGIVGYWNVDVLVPCPPEEADGSSPTLPIHSTWMTLPDIEITEILRNGSSPIGLTYYYPDANTMRLEATRDFRSWTNVAYIFGGGSYTSWTNDVPLSNFGSSYRLELVAEGHGTNLPPLNPVPSGLAAETPSGKSLTTSTIPAAQGPRLLARSLSGPDGEFTFSSIAGRTYSVSLLNDALQPSLTQEVRATASTTTVRLQTARPDFGFLKIQERVTD